MSPIRSPMDGITQIGFPEDVLRRAAAGVLLVEGESQELAMALVDGSLKLHHPQAIPGNVAQAIRKASSVILTLRSNGMLAEPTK